jgi:fructose/tagatose bisphosphate aldolase
MKSLREVLKDAGEQKIAIGHFNFSNLEGLWAIVRAAKDVGVPVILGLSEGERDFVGVKTAVALVKSVREELDHPIFLNADHTYSVERVVEAARAGFDAVIYDGAKLSAEENIKNTKEAVQKAKEINPKDYMNEFKKLKENDNEYIKSFEENGKKHDKFLKDKHEMHKIEVYEKQQKHNQSLIKVHENQKEHE